MSNNNHLSRALEVWMAPCSVPLSLAMHAMNEQEGCMRAAMMGMTSAIMPADPFTTQQHKQNKDVEDTPWSAMKGGGDCDLMGA